MAVGTVKIAIVIASKGRPTELGRWIEHAARQVLRPTQLIWSVTSPADLPAGVVSDPVNGFEILIGTAGSCVQRNRALDVVREDTDFVTIFDDDYIPSTTCLADVARFFAGHPTAAGATGRLLADGIHGEALSAESAFALLRTFESEPGSRPEPSFDPTRPIYGCNMAFRFSAVQHVRFDEGLPLYAWQEDVDFAFRVAERGPVGVTDAFVGVHQGVKGGRTSGTRLGYSQVANPIYLYRKGTMPFKNVASLVMRNVVSNHLKFIRPEPLIDRRGRTRGNWIAAWHLVQGRLDPRNILAL